MSLLWWVVDILGGRWHCGSCASCVSCGCKTPAGDGRPDASLEWIFETKIDMKVRSLNVAHTMQCKL